MLAGVSGQISLGHGALMAVGAYTVCLLIGNEGWALIPALVASVVVAAAVGVPLGAAASRLRGSLPCRGDARVRGWASGAGRPLPGDVRRRERTRDQSEHAARSLGANFSLEHWEAWIACAGALLVMFVLYNLIHSGSGRSLRAVRDDEIAAAVCGLSVGRMQTLAFIVSAGVRRSWRRAAGGRGCSWPRPARFRCRCRWPCSSASCSAASGHSSGRSGERRCSCCCRTGPTTSRNSFSLSTNVKDNMPLAVYGVVLIGAMLIWPSGIQGGVRALAVWARGARSRRSRPAEPPRQPEAVHDRPGSR